MKLTYDRLHEAAIFWQDQSDKLKSENAELKKLLGIAGKGIAEKNKQLAAKPDLRYFASIVITACEEKLGIKILPENVDKAAELIDDCETALDFHIDLLSGAEGKTTKGEK